MRLAATPAAVKCAHASVDRNPFMYGASMSEPHTRDLNGNICECVCVCIVRSGTCSNKNFYPNSSKF